MTRARLLAKTAALALLALFVVTAGLAAWMLTTRAGLERAVAIADSLDALDLRLDGAEGTLAGPLSAERLYLRAGTATVEAERLSIDYRPAGLLFGRLRVASLSAESLRVTLEPEESPKPPGRPRFLPRWLAIDAGAVAVARVEVLRGEKMLFQAREVRASGTVTHARIRVRDASLDGGFFTVRGEAGLAAREPLALEGNLEWTLGPGREWAGRLEARGDLDRLEADATLSAPLEASVTGTLTGLGRDLAWQVQAKLARLDLADLGVSAPFGPLDGRLSGSGDLSSATLQARVEGTGLPEGGVDLAAHVRGGPQAIDIDLFEAALVAAPTTVEARGRVELGEAPAVLLQADWKDLRWPLVGDATVESPQGRLGLEGWRQLAFGVDGQLVARGFPAMRVSARGILDQAGVTVSAANLAGRLGRLSGSGYLGFGEQRPWQADARVEALDLGQLRPGLDSRLAARFAASGAGVGDDLAFAGALGSLSGTVRGQPAKGAGLVRYRPGRWEFGGVEVDLGPARLTAEGWTGADTRLTAELDVGDLADFAPQFGGRVEAKLVADSPRAAAGGGRDLRLDLSLRGRDLAWGAERAAVLSADAVVDLGDLDQSWVRVRAAGMTLAGQAINTTRLSLDGYARAHRFEFRVGAGERAVDLEGEGSFLNGIYRFTASRLTPAGPGLRPWSLEAPMAGTASAGSATLEETCLVQEARRVCFQGRWRSGDGWSAALGTESFPLQALDVSLPGQPGYEGLLDLDVALEGPAGEPWTGRAIGRLRDAELSFVAPSGRPERLALGSTELVVTSEPAAHRILLTVRDSDLLRLDGEATVERAAGVEAGASPLSGRLSVATRELGLLPLLLPDIDRAAGRLDADLVIAGTVAQPAIEGSVTLADGALEFYQTNLRLQDVGARIDLDDNRARIDVTGRTGEGEFRVDGLLGWRQGEIAGTVNFKGERLLLANLPELRVEASPDLGFRLDGRRIEVGGKIDVPAARIEPRQFTGAVTASADEVLIDGEPKDPADRYLVSTDLRLTLGRRVRVDAFGLKGRLEGDVLLRTRPDEVPTASGELTVEDAKYKAYTKELDVERGRLLFAGGPVDDPGVDLRAIEKLPGYEVGVLVRGRLRQPELTLFSDPALPQSQIASLLLVGRTLDSLQTGDSEAIGSSADIAAQGGALLAGQLGRYIGLDEVGLQTDAEREASLVLGKFLSPRLYVSYGISLSDAINTFKLRYTIGDRWVIRGESGLESSADIEYTIER